MQVHQITPYANKYSSNGVQRPEAKNPNFGLRLTVDKSFFNEIKKLIGDSGLQEVKKRLKEMGQDANLIKRFQRVFEEKRHLQLLFGKQKVPRNCKCENGCDINPIELVEGWNDLEAKLSASDLGRDVGMDCYDNGAYVNDTRPKAGNVINAIKCAINDVLDKYAEAKIGFALTRFDAKK